MKERVLDVLMYLFDHCVGENELLHPTEQDSLISELESAGFSGKEIDKAFNWLDGIHEMEIESETDSKPFLRSFRIYTDEECRKLDVQSRSLLLTLQQLGVINDSMREVIIDRAMALDMDEIKIEHFKWVTLMVMINRGSDKSLEWLEEIVFNDFNAVLQ